MEFRSLAYAALEAATGGFDAARVVGRGGFGPVYRGELGGRDVAVKVLEAAGQQGLPEFQREVDVLSRCLHENVVPLRAVCLAPRAGCPRATGGRRDGGPDGDERAEVLRAEGGPALSDLFSSSPTRHAPRPCRFPRSKSPSYRSPVAG